MSSPSPKMLLVFCDGTGADGTLTGTGVSYQCFAAFASGPADLCVCRFFRDPISTSSKRTSGDNQKQQIVLYMTGVGSEAGFDGTSVPQAPLLQAYGTSVASKIRDAYAFIAQNFQVGDEICIFGFFRGAYIARKLSGLIDMIGLLAREQLENFFSIWSALVERQEPTIPPGTRSTRIKCVGVWDTVGAIYDALPPEKPVRDALSVTDPILPANVDIALHTLSLQENRNLFLPTLWEMPKGGWRDNQVIKQGCQFVWFPGSHCDVGGDCKKHDLSDLALFWMVGEIKSFIDIDTSFIEKIVQSVLKPWGEAQPLNGYVELNSFLKYYIKPQTRLDGGVIKPDIVFHESILHAPTILTCPQHMLTLATLKQAFGGSWKPTIVPLNEFEQYCKDKWGKQSKLNTNANVRHGDFGIVSENVTFESALDLLP
ncbi:hypothetical protein EDC04DRAFT_3026286 [Pisolithus marmoratus]|nr:hypothetical protein EDC04DRAFT_3026286 [Pisolithus marmoratus]